MKKNKKKKIKKVPLGPVLFCKKNLLRDIIMVTISVGVSVFIIISQRQSFLGQKQEAPPQSVAEDTTAAELENEAEYPIIDTTNWKTYATQWYGFELKYPEQWNKPLLKNASVGNKWEYRYQFRKSETDQSTSYLGFDVVIYSVEKVKEVSNTDEFPAVKNEERKVQGLCQEIEGHVAENESYPAEQVYIGQNDDCYNPAYFYTLTREDYMYNIVPILTGPEKTFQSEKEIIENFPEFISVSSTFNLIGIVRPKPAKTKPKITAPEPIAVTKRDKLGRRICAKENDKPSKSIKNKKKHLDMECCLDPDEYPNPHCYYSKDKYGKYL